MGSSADNQSMTQQCALKDCNRLYGIPMAKHILVACETDTI